MILIGWSKYLDYTIVHIFYWMLNNFNDLYYAVHSVQMWFNLFKYSTILDQENEECPKIASQPLSRFSFRRSKNFIKDLSAEDSQWTHVSQRKHVVIFPE